MTNKKYIELDSLISAIRKHETNTYTEYLEGYNNGLQTAIMEAVSQPASDVLERKTLERRIYEFSKKNKKVL